LLYTMTSSSHCLLYSTLSFFCCCRNGRAFSSHTSKTSGLPTVKN